MLIYYHHTENDITTSKTKKRPRDFNQLAGQLVGEAVGDIHNKDNDTADSKKRLGGLKGGKPEPLS